MPGKCWRAPDVQGQKPDGWSIKAMALGTQKVRLTAESPLYGHCASDKVARLWHSQGHHCLGVIETPEPGNCSMGAMKGKSTTQVWVGTISWGLKMQRCACKWIWSRFGTALCHLCFPGSAELDWKFLTEIFSKIWFLWDEKFSTSSCRITFCVPTEGTETKGCSMLVYLFLILYLLKLKFLLCRMSESNNIFL